MGKSDDWEARLWRGIASVSLPLAQPYISPEAPPYRPAPVSVPIPSGDIGSILLEQLEFIIETRHGHGHLCACRTCEKYRRISKLLLEPFQ